MNNLLVYLFNLIRTIFFHAFYLAGFDTRSFYSGELGERKITHEPRCLLCWLVLVIG